MKETLEKLNKIKEEILAEKKEGLLRLFALIERNDLEGKWDLIFSADWLEKTNSEKDLVYLIEKIKSEFGENIDFLARILAASPKEIFIQEFSKAILRESKEYPTEIRNLAVSSTFTANHLFVITIDFTGIDLEKIEGINEGPLAIKEVSDF